VHLVGLTIGIYSDARTNERQIHVVTVGDNESFKNLFAELKYGALICHVIV
jgi:hypothetical protein